MRNNKTYSEVVNELQKTIYFLLKENTNVCSYVQVGDNKFNIYDGNPTSQGRIGFPYIEVHTPTFNEEFLTFKKRNITFTIRIEVIDKIESNVRELVDVVRSALQEGRQRTRKKGYWNLKTTNTSLTPRFLPNESSKPVWVYVLFVSYEWRGCYIG